MERANANPPGRMPVLFVGHGSPMNAIEDNDWSRGFRALGAALPRPKLILAISAHWFVPGTFLTGDERPKTIHDFSGFPPALYSMRYPARGDVEAARHIVRILGEERASLSTAWGIDHGVWTVLRHMRPQADCPVVELSMDQRIPPAEHLELGRKLAPLRDDGVLVIGSGNIVHNLRYAMMRKRRGDVSTPPWAARFDEEVAHAAERHDADFLVRALDTEDGSTSHPTPEHYLPLLYAFGAAGEGGGVRFPISGFDMGSLSMRAIVFA